MMSRANDTSKHNRDGYRKVVYLENNYLQNGNVQNISIIMDSSIIKVHQCLYAYCKRLTIIDEKLFFLLPHFRIQT